MTNQNSIQEEIKLREESRLRVFANKVLRQLFGHNDIGLAENTGKTKYMEIGRHPGK